MKVLLLISIIRHCLSTPQWCKSSFSQIEKELELENKKRLSYKKLFYFTLENKCITTTMAMIVFFNRDK